ncbi:putative quinol monooxygenase [Mucilaginibacter terrae]|uniref:Quinol monooxygenase YgiN n=1 Tax=Mucilaginibacter terrae TaxID=1955052 RepID=A0ABU3H0A6_9SPHI|nr:antibiotic biosynthesis monooxygenase [Mucilaginibacter terrae]MDT3405447.1 quinol monooxygenase YgiN [Mucilaginibacter terrae]
MQSADNISLTAEINILPGFENEVLAAAEMIWIATRKEIGCEAFLFNTKKDTPNVIVFFEVFKSQADFDAHVGFDHTVAFINFLKGKVVGDGPSLTFLNQYKD